jgi:single-strand DNA-binding protein
MSEPLKLTGKVIVIFDTQTFASGFQKREFVVETLGQYPQKIKFEAMKDGCTRLDSYQVGDELTVSYNLRGNEYQGKYYVCLQAWRLERVGGDDFKTQDRSSHQNGAAPPPRAREQEYDDDEIPF